MQRSPTGYRGPRSWCSGPRWLFSFMGSSRCEDGDGNGRVLLGALSWRAFWGGFCVKRFHCGWKSWILPILWKCLLTFSSKSIFFLKKWRWRNTLFLEDSNTYMLPNLNMRIYIPTNKCAIPLFIMRDWRPDPLGKHLNAHIICYPGKVAGHKSSVMAFFALQRIKRERESYLFLKIEKSKWLIYPFKFKGRNPIQQIYCLLLRMNVTMWPFISYLAKNLNPCNHLVFPPSWVIHTKSQSK